MDDRRKGMLITLEGVEGSGKTSQIPHITDYLHGRGREVVVTREPGGTPAGKRIRAILLDPENRDLEPLSELLLYAADRAQHIRTVIKPALATGKIVLCDRFHDATTVYQGYARGLDLDMIHRLHRIVLDNVSPDLTLLFDLPPETGLARAWRAVDDGNRGAAETRFEKEALQFHEKVRNGYLELAVQDPRRFRIIDADQDPREVHLAVIRVLEAEGV